MVSVCAPFRISVRGLVAGYQSLEDSEPLFVNKFRRKKYFFVQKLFLSWRCFEHRTFINLFSFDAKGRLLQDLQLGVRIDGSPCDARADPFRCETLRVYAV